MKKIIIILLICVPIFFITKCITYNYKCYNLYNSHNVEEYNCKCGNFKHDSIEKVLRFKQDSINRVNRMNTKDDDYNPTIIINPDGTILMF